MISNNYRDDFPIFKNNPELIFLDSWASSQKPKYVIDWVSEFTANDYANIHRWDYLLSEKSEDLYFQSKQLVSEFINCKSSEIIYTYNSTYAFNMLVQSLVNSNMLKSGDTVLLWIREHHANIVPWQILAEKIWFNIKFINLLEDYSIDREDFDHKYDETVSVVSIWHVSNVTWQIYDVQKIKSKLRNDTFFVVDWSQSFPHMPIDIEDIWCDCFIFTAHKVMAYTGLGAMFLSRKHIKTLQPMISGWWAIKDVDVNWFSLPTTLEKFEAGTPNIIWAVSLLKALEYIESIWWMEAIWEHEQEITKYTLQKFIDIEQKYKNKFKLIWSNNLKNRIAVFSFYLPENKNFNKVWEIFAEKNIAIRCGWHCAHPLHKELAIPGTCIFWGFKRNYRGLILYKLIEPIKHK